MSFTVGTYHHGQGYANSSFGPGSTGTSEPMALGSPPTSPNALQSHGGSHYLPGFLMGVGSTTSTLPQTEGAYSQSRPVQLSPTHASPTNAGMGQFQPTGYPQIDRPSKHHPTSPPTQSLRSISQQKYQQPGTPRNTQFTNPWDPTSVGGGSGSGIRHSTPCSASAIGSVPQRSSNTGPFRSPHTAGGFRNPNVAAVNSPLVHNRNVLTPEHLSDALNAQKSSQVDRIAEDCWVTVFGYPTARAAFILSQFSQFGTIEKHVTTNDGNWMHIKYQNKLQARCAASRNGRVFGDNIMVGVSPCTNQDVMNEKITTSIPMNESALDRENSFVGFVSPATNRVPNATPMREHSEVRPLSRLRNNTSLLNHSYATPMDNTKPANDCGVARHSSMRALAGEYRVSQLNRTASVRQNKDSGLLSKALGYMFGWS